MRQQKSNAGHMVRLALAMLLFAIVVGALAYNQVEGWSLFDSFYMVVVGRVATDGTVAFIPAPTDTIEAGSMLIVLRHRAKMDRFAVSIST